MKRIAVSATVDGVTWCCWALVEPLSSRQRVRVAGLYAFERDGVDEPSSDGCPNIVALALEDAAIEAYLAEHGSTEEAASHYRIRVSP